MNSKKYSNNDESIVEQGNFKRSIHLTVRSRLITVLIKNINNLSITMKDRLVADYTAIFKVRVYDFFKMINNVSGQSFVMFSCL